MARVRGSDAAFRVDGIDAEGFGLALAEHGDEAAPDHRQDGCPERGGRDQHLVAGLQSKRVECRQQGGGAIAMGEGVFASGKTAEIGFKFLDHRMRADVSIAHDPEHGGFIRGGKHRPFQEFFLGNGD